MDMIIPGIFGLVVATIVWRGVLNVRRRIFLDAYVFPHSVQRHLQREFPQYGTIERAEIFAGLRDWFRIAQDGKNRSLSMPSKIVDEAWHSFILDTRAYREFCRRAFGRYYDHVPAEAMRSPTQAQEGVRHTWRLACAIEKIDRKAPTQLPRIFGLDARLAVAGGYVYALDCQLGDDRYCASSIGCASGCGGDGDGGGCGGD